MVDSHAHISALDDAEDVLARAKAVGITQIVNICTDPATLEKGIALARKYKEIFNVAATTPHDVEKEGELFFPIVDKHAASGDLVAIGETGLDYYYEHSPKQLQQHYLRLYLDLAKKHRLPLVIHCRDAFDDLFSILGDEPRVLLHCFTGTIEEAKTALGRGWMISFSGIVTFKKSEGLREAAKIVPLERMLVETDTPYLAPQSKRGKANEPAFMVETVEFLAQLKGIDTAKLSAITAKNAETFFSFSKHVRRV